MSYRNLAAEKWPGCEIHGCGQWALKAEHSADVYLYTEKANAIASAPFHNCVPIDLQVGVANFNVLDRMPDRSDARRR